MTTPLFKKIATFTDIHFGKSSNDHNHNRDCLEFVEWFIKTAKEANVDTIAFLGDFHHSRHNLHVRTMHYSLKALELLSEAFENFYFIPGNHDLFFKERRDLSSVEWARNINNVNLITEVTHIGDVTFCPWLVGDELNSMKNNSGKYCFGHFEIPHFIMNGSYGMPDKGHGPYAADFINYELAFTGHFHARQMKENVIYTGNCFPHDFGDAWDDERGMMILEWGGAPEFISWPNAPRYRTLTLSKLLTDPALYLNEYTYARVEVDIDITFEEATLIRETMSEQYKIKKLEFIQNNNEFLEKEFDENVEFQTVDQIVIDGLRSFEKGKIDPEQLVNIYIEL